MIPKYIDIVQKHKVTTHISSKTSESLLLGILLAIVGGFLDAYTFIGRDGVFANAQTGNIVLMSIEALKGNWMQTLFQALPIFAFVIGVMVAEKIKNTSPILFIPDAARVVLIIEIVILFIIGFIPNNVHNVLVTVTISFVASLQVSTFRKLGEYSYATTMCTGNLRSGSHAAYIAFTKKDRESAIKAIHYFIIIFSFIFGAFFGGMLTSSIGSKAVWCSVVILICSLILFSIDEHKANANKN